MNTPYLIYDITSGAIKRMVQCPVTAIHSQIAEGEDFIVGTIRDNNYLVDPSTAQLMSRPLMSVKFVGDNLTGVPDGAVITIEDQTYTADGTSIELGFSHAGTYPVTITLWPYLDWSHTFEITTSE